MTSSPAGIDCPGDCTGAFAPGATIPLAATMDQWTGVTWSGDCTGTDPNGCSVTMDQPRTVTATFSDLGPAHAHLNTPDRRTDPLRVSFDEPVHHLTTNNVVLRPKQGRAVAASLRCFNASGARTSCATGKVRRATLVPDAPLLRGKSYAAIVDPAGVAPDRRPRPQRGRAHARYVLCVTDDVIVAERLTKSYGSTRGVTDLSFSVHAGEVFGYLGPNGAGKSTTIRTMLDFHRPTSGRITVFGRGAARRPGRGARPRRVRARASSGCTSGCRCATTSTRTPRSATAPAATGSVRSPSGSGSTSIAPIHELSHGNKQKIGLVQAFMHEPDLLVLDEPTQGLDPLVQQTFYELIDEARARGGTVFLSSHILPEVERICDRVGIIRDGTLLTVDDIGDLKAKALRSDRLPFRGADPGRRLRAPARPSSPPRGTATPSRSPCRASSTRSCKAAAQHTVVNVETREPSLEEIFLRAYRDGSSA